MVDNTKDVKKFIQSELFLYLTFNLSLAKEKYYSWILAFKLPVTDQSQAVNKLTGSELSARKRILPQLRTKTQSQIWVLSRNFMG